MNKEKQIKEMARDVCTLIEEYGSCKKCDAELAIEDDTCIYKCMAKLFAEKGYRKASDVAELEAKLADVTANWQKIHDAYNADCIKHYNKGRSEVADEIFEEIEQLLDDCSRWDYLAYGKHYYTDDDGKISNGLAELKKKFTEERNESSE